MRTRPTLRYSQVARDVTAIKYDENVALTGAAASIAVIAAGAMYFLGEEAHVLVILWFLCGVMGALGFLLLSRPSMSPSLVRLGYVGLVLGNAAAIVALVTLPYLAILLWLPIGASVYFLARPAAWRRARSKQGQQGEVDA